METLITKLQQKFKHVEQRGDKIIISIFYNNGNPKNWWSIYKVENGDFRLTKGGIQKTDGNEDYILDICLRYIN